MPQTLIDIQKEIAELIKTVDSLPSFVFKSERDKNFHENDLKIASLMVAPDHSLLYLCGLISKTDAHICQMEYRDIQKKNELASSDIKGLPRPYFRHIESLKPAFSEVFASLQDGDLNLAPPVKNKFMTHIKNVRRAAALFELTFLNRQELKYDLSDILPAPFHVRYGQGQSSVQGDGVAAKGADGVVAKGAAQSVVQGDDGSANQEVNQGADQRKAPGADGVAAKGAAQSVVQGDDQRKAQGADGPTAKGAAQSVVQGDDQRKAQGADGPTAKGAAQSVVQGDDGSANQEVNQGAKHSANQEVIQKGMNKANSLAEQAGKPSLEEQFAVLWDTAMALNSLAQTDKKNEEARCLLGVLACKHFHDVLEALVQKDEDGFNPGVMIRTRKMAAYFKGLTPKINALNDEQVQAVFKALIKTTRAQLKSSTDEADWQAYVTNWYDMCTADVVKGFKKNAPFKANGQAGEKKALDISRQTGKGVSANEVGQGISGEETAINRLQKTRRERTRPMRGDILKQLHLTAAFKKRLHRRG